LEESGIEGRITDMMSGAASIMECVYYLFKLCWFVMQSTLVRVVLGTWRRDG
jgi:hypothetical protein